ncbi:MAG: hypothetical protein H0V00_07670 [Chloroflexia bacterium]|nr:hypothetical protein [Chloroflexia bacterium]
MGGRHDEARADNHGTNEDFKKDCEKLGGVFIDSPKDKLTICVYPDGDKKTCDQSGNQCKVVTNPKRFENGPLRPIGGIDELPAFDSANPVLADPALDQIITAAEAPGTRASGGKKRRSGGNRRK